MKNSQDIEILAVQETYDFKENARLCAEYGMPVVQNGIATLGVQESLGEFWAWSTYASLRANIEVALQDDEVKAIALLINSPGGEVGGLFECCNYIKNASAKKPIIAHVTGLCCSAAYAIASSCTSIYATQTSEVGCIGVICSARDYEEYDKKRGILSKIFRSKNADKKNLSPFTEEGEKDIQAKLDFYENCFYDLIAGSRNMSKEECIENFGHGATFMADEALSKGMIDGVCEYAEFIENLTSSLTKGEEEEDTMDISKMSAEERKELFNALVELEPSLKAKDEGTILTEERERVTSLLAVRTEATKTIVDSAIAEGKKADEIAMDLFKAEQARAEELAKATSPLEQLAERAEGQTEVVTPAPSASTITDSEAHECAERVKKYRKERLNG